MQSYIGLIALAILSTPEQKLVLSDIYKWILDNYLYFRNRGTGWKNSIRHNLSLNDCFVKVGRSSNGKGHYWSIHPANVDDFSKGDFRRQRAQQRVKKHQALLADDCHDYQSDMSVSNDENEGLFLFDRLSSSPNNTDDNDTDTETPKENHTIVTSTSIAFDQTVPHKPKKRPFDIDSLLSDDYIASSKKPK